MAENLRRGARVTGPDRSKLASDLAERYGAGESIRSLASSTGRSYGFIHRILTEIGRHPPEPGRRPQAEPRSPSSLRLMP